MIRRRGAIACCALLALLVGAGVRAEISTDETDGELSTLVMMSITDGADPVGDRWRAWRDLSPDRFLNAEGDLRPDGLPDVSWFPNGAPAVVWAYKNPTHHDIAFSRWTTDGWSTLQFLASGAGDELDPRLYIGPNGVVHVVWWEAGSDARVHALRTAAPVTEGDTTTAWGAARRINPLDEPARRPSVAHFGGAIRIAYERVSPSATSAPGEVAVLREEPGGQYVVEHVVTSQRTDDIRPVLHVREGQVWLDWIYSETQFASSRFENGQWQPTRIHPWSDASWVGLEGLRKSIGSRIVPSVAQSELPVEEGPPPGETP